MRVLVVGDMHANASFALTVKGTAEHFNVEEIWQLGDFGWWPHADSNRSHFLDLMNDAPVPVYFVDGNHENHKYLHHDAPEPYTPLKHYHNLWHLPRGYVRTVAGRRVLSIGGAVSVDKYHRTEGYSWFVEEKPTQTQLGRSTTSGKVDIVLSHDAPAAANLHLTGNWPKDLTDESFYLRCAMSNVMFGTKPSIWMCGHYHQNTYTRIDYDEGFTDIHVLDCDGAAGSMYILDLETLYAVPIRRQEFRTARRT